MSDEQKRVCDAATTYIVVVTNTLASGSETGNLSTGQCPVQALRCIVLAPAGIAPLWGTVRCKGVGWLRFMIFSLGS